MVVVVVVVVRKPTVTTAFKPPNPPTLPANRRNFSTFRHTVFSSFFTWTRYSFQSNATLLFSLAKTSACLLRLWCSRGLIRWRHT